MLFLRRVVTLVVLAGVATVAASPRAFAQDATAEQPGESMPAMDVPEEVEEDDGGLILAADAALASKYIWRGINLVDDAVFQPSVTVGYSSEYGDVTLNIWGSMELTDENTYPGHGDAEGEFTEVDYTLDYSFPITDIVGASVGVIHYDFPNTGFDATTEVYAGVGVDVLLSPSLTIYRDVDEAEGTYVQGAIGHTIYEWEAAEGDVTGSVDIGTSAAFGDSNHNDFYYGVDDATFTNWDVSLALPVNFGSFSVTPSLNYSRLLDDDIRDNFDDDDNLWGAIAVGWSF